MNEKQPNEKKLTFLEHLEELRKRFLCSLIALLITSTTCWFTRDFLLTFLKKPLPQGYELYFFTPTEGIITVMKICFFTGIFFASPVILYQIWAFIMPALKIKERKEIIPIVLFSAGLFLAGLIMAFYLFLPFTLKFLITFTPTGIKPMLSLSNYISFILYFSLLCALIFQLPIVMFFLVKLNILSPQFFKKRRKELIIIALIFAAIITPTVDPINQLLIAIPLILLYEIGIIVSSITYFIRQKKEKADV